MAEPGTPQLINGLRALLTAGRPARFGDSMLRDRNGHRLSPDSHYASARAAGVPFRTSSAPRRHWWAFHFAIPELPPSQFLKDPCELLCFCHGQFAGEILADVSGGSPLNRSHQPDCLNMLGQPILAFAAVRQQHDFVRQVAFSNDAEKLCRFRQLSLAGHHDLYRFGHCQRPTLPASAAEQQASVPAQRETPQERAPPPVGILFDQKYCPI